MRRVVKIGEKDLDLLATATTPIRYKSVFGGDVMVAITQIHDGKREIVEAIDIITQLAYIMNRQAECSKEVLAKLSKEDFLDWLEDFGSMAFINAAMDIMDVYLETTESKSQPKNAVSRPKGK